MKSKLHGTKNTNESRKKSKSKLENVLIQSEKKEIKWIQIGNGVKLSLLAEEMILHIGSS